jgi:hypothetical protein
MIDHIVESLATGVLGVDEFMRAVEDQVNALKSAERNPDIVEALGDA